ncbi:HIRAN domain-containing protein [Leifsonia sp. H3M29-4]|uniref:HIRAN domain-containing protein n=1 Tax=Salinibacterium metalliresistens TaxID=3031321 RepID=UPI0023DC6DE4|nr:HIRAN domain-containing protein [Salinibacterium metalliresistens]MDF1478246.1 HIRAN domain-containing protein [Salinibacterium metalliresistens]
MAGLFTRLLGGSDAPQGAQQYVVIGAGWPDVEVEGEAYRRAEVSRLFKGIGRPEGGVTMQQAQLVPEPSNRYDRNAVKVIIRGEHVGYVPADLSARVASECKRLGRGSVAVVPARVWARVDGGTWRARVTLSFTGASEDEQDYAEQRRGIEERDAQKAAALAQKAAEREARESAKAARRETGTVRDMYWTTWKPSIAELKRQQRLEEARAFLIECRAAASRESALTGEVPDPWPTEQLAAVIRRLGDRDGELATLEEYAVECGTRTMPDSMVAKLAKARLARGAAI